MGPWDLGTYLRPQTKLISSPVFVPPVVDPSMCYLPLPFMPGIHHPSPIIS